MLKKLLSALLLLIPPAFAATPPLQQSDTSQIKRVIYITLDGVRWQDIFKTHRYLPTFWEKYAKSAEIYGEPGTNRTMEVASVPISLPSYQSQMTGMVTQCHNNECSGLPVETLAEALIKKARLKKHEVASISCWEVMDNAFESRIGTAFSNHGTRPMHDPYTFEIDPIMKAINMQQAEAYPGDDTRTDEHTLAQSLHYLKKYQPKFLWISLGETDDHAHDGKLEEYHQTLRFYDLAIDKVVKLVKSLKLEGETMIIITTDHGRGNGKNWTEHDETMPEAKQTWAFVLNGKLENGIQDGKMHHYSTLSIRPTIEKVFGIK
ncbi:MAG TPA: alkaline phosphatase family protein [Gammaproteobacteria bacterium]|nr:alkaline phosphatase family protein [Gammaproteobacteria bacterium]